MSGTVTAGRRVHNGNGYSFGNMSPGDYGVGPDGKRWWLCAPNGDRGTIDLEKHTLTEHDDGTITISPSAVFVDQACHCERCADRNEAFAMLYFDDHPIGGWHGWLERGIWREA